MEIAYPEFTFSSLLIASGGVADLPSRSAPVAR